MEYAYNKEKEKWFSLSTYEFFDTLDLKNKIKLYNRRPYLHNIKYTYIDISDIKLILNDGSMFGTYSLDKNSCITYRFISKGEIVNLKSTYKKIKENFEFVPKYAKMLIESYLDFYCCDADSEEKTLKGAEQYIRKYLSDEQYLAYELLGKDDIINMIQCKMYKGGGKK